MRWKRVPFVSLVLGGAYIGATAGTLALGLGFGIVAAYAYKGLVGGWEDDVPKERLL